MWNEIIKAESKKDYFKEIEKFIIEDSEKYTIYPKKKDIFNAFKYCSFEKTKICLLGQDPYINDGQAHGLSFSVPNGIRIPPSLQNIFKELKSDLNIESPKSGNLIGWAKQGVLLLNSILTVRAGESGSHKITNWETFTDRIISTLDQKDETVVFILWGAFARKKAALITNQPILQSAHPSPLSAHNGFFGSRPFSKANQFLIDTNLSPIDWGRFE